MLSQKIDSALDALLACMMRLPALRDCYRPGTPERAAIDDLMVSLQRTDRVLFDPRVGAPELSGAVGRPPDSAYRTPPPSVR